jgi:hypothetical protein
VLALTLIVPFQAVVLKRSGVFLAPPVLFLKSTSGSTPPVPVVQIAGT